MSKFTISNVGFSLIEKFESYRREAYQDSVGVWTVGYGTIRLNGSPVRKGDVLDQETARTLMRNEAQSFVDAVSGKILVSLTQNQIDSIASFVYNLGATNFLSSTLLKKINLRDWTGAGDQFVRIENGRYVGWINAGGKPLKGLINRRLAEKELFLQNAWNVNG